MASTQEADAAPPAQERVEIRCPTQLLVEGRDYQSVLLKLLERRRLPAPQIQDFGGVDDLSAFLSAFKRTRHFETVRRLGIVRDAESDARRAFQSVQGALERNGLAAPKTPGLFAGEGLQVGVLVVPGDGAGNLETLLCRTIGEPSVNSCIDSFLECIESAEGHTIRQRDKARAYAYLATRRRPLRSVGVAGRKGDWDFGHEALTPLAAFAARVAGGTERLD